MAKHYIYIMKKAGFIFCLILISCGSKNKVLMENSGFLKTECPSDGICSLKVEQNKAIRLTNENTINFFPYIQEGKNIVLTFEYKRNDIPNTVDGHYSEQVILELDPNNLEIALTGKALQNVKLLFGRFCYCKGQTGYYNINNGSLKVEKLNNGEYYISISFSQDSVPQIITFIGETFII
jgi:hypothetical protein